MYFELKKSLYLFIFKVKIVHKFFLNIISDKSFLFLIVLKYSFEQMVDFGSMTKLFPLPGEINESFTTQNSLA